MYAKNALPFLQTSCRWQDKTCDDFVGRCMPTLPIDGSLSSFYGRRAAARQQRRRIPHTSIGSLFRTASRAKAQSCKSVSSLLRTADRSLPLRRFACTRISLASDTHTFVIISIFIDVRYGLDGCQHFVCGSIILLSVRNFYSCTTVLFRTCRSSACVPPEPDTNCPSHVNILIRDRKRKQRLDEKSDQTSRRLRQ